MAERTNGWMDRWGSGGWRQECYVLASIHRRAHQRQSDIYGAADGAGPPSAAGAQRRDTVSCAGRTPPPYIHGSRAEGSC